MTTSEFDLRTVRDGIVYEPLYWNEPVRAAFILKELPFTPDDELKNLTNWLYDWSQSDDNSYGGDQLHFHMNPELENISRCMMLIDNVNLSYTECRALTSIRKNLARTAIFYLEKNEEYYAVRYDEDSYAEGLDGLTKEVRDRRDEIIIQLKNANPALVLCCNTFQHVVEEIFNLSTSVERLPCGASYFSIGSVTTNG